LLICSFDLHLWIFSHSHLNKAFPPTDVPSTILVNPLNPFLESPIEKDKRSLDLIETDNRPDVFQVRCPLEVYRVIDSSKTQAGTNLQSQHTL
jgi:hypothetical protein